MLVFKICSAIEWQTTRASGQLLPSADDRRDGFIHLSTAAQAGGTLARHFAGKPDLVMLAIEAAALGDALRWEASRGGELFPHLYGPLSASQVAWWRPIEVDASGVHALPTDVV